MIAQINTKTRECRLFDIRKLSPRECFRLMGVSDDVIDRLQQTVDKAYTVRVGVDEHLAVLDMQPDEEATDARLKRRYEELISELERRPRRQPMLDVETGVDGLVVVNDIGGDGDDDRDEGLTDEEREAERKRITDAYNAARRAAKEKRFGPQPILAHSAQYKLAGNSIVVDCLERIFRNVWQFDGEAETALRLQATRQTSLFDMPDFAPRWQPLPLPSDHPLLVATLCSGYDAQCLAFDRLTEDVNRQLMLTDSHATGTPRLLMQYDLIAWAEFDPESKRPLDEQPAVVAHNLIYPQWNDRNLGDMTQIDWQAFINRHDDYTVAVRLSDGTERYHSMPLRTIIDREGIDLLTYSTPCQSISQAGKRDGIAKDSGTRSAVLWYTEEAVHRLRPKIAVQENVAALVNQQNRPHFEQWQQTLERLGYRNYWAVLNARDYGVPQNRERVFMVSVRDDINPTTEYPFPQPIPLTRCIADVLEPDASPALYLKPESVTSFLQKNEDGQQQYIYATVSHRPTSTQIEALIAEQTTE